MSNLAYNRNAAGLEWVRVSRRQPCPVCHKPDFCEISGDGRTIHCMRIASPRPATYRQGGWFHSTAIDGWPATRPGLSYTAADLRPLNNGAEAEPVKLTSLEKRDKAIRYLLERLELSQEHQKYLSEQDISREQALKLGYRTLPRQGRDKLVKEIVALVGEADARGLAFIYCKRGRGGSGYFQFAAARPDLLLLPVREVNGLLAGLKARWETRDATGAQTERHYRALSAGSSGGASLGTPLHVAFPPQKIAAARVVVTEGEKKADYIARRTGLICVGVSGTGNWKGTHGGGHLLPTLATLGAAQVEIAFDADLENNPRVARDLYQMGCQLQAAGLEVQVRRWPLSAAKGYDDLLRAGLAQISRLEPFSPIAPSSQNSGGWVKKFVELDPETLDILTTRADTASFKPDLPATTNPALGFARPVASALAPALKPLFSVEEARREHSRLFGEVFAQHCFTLGQRRQSVIVTSNPGSGKTHAALGEALKAVKDFPQGRFLYLTDNKEVYRQWIKPGGLLHQAWQSGLVAIREGRQKEAGAFECRRLEECRGAGKQRHAPTWDVCATCPFYNRANWQNHLRETGKDHSTPMEWECHQQGYWHEVETARQARLVLAPKASMFNNSHELAEYDLIILDEGMVEHLLEKVDVTRETLANWRESILRQSESDSLAEEGGGLREQDYGPYLRLFELIEHTLLQQCGHLAQAEPGSRQRMWPFLPLIQGLAGRQGAALNNLLEECLAVPTGHSTGRYAWERPYTRGGQLVFPLHFGRELVKALYTELHRQQSDTRLWYTQPGQEPELVVLQPRQHLLQILRGVESALPEESARYKNHFGRPPSVILLDATPSPMLKYALGEETRRIGFEVAQHLEVTQLTNSLYTREELLARQGKALAEVSRLLEQESRNYRSAAIFCHKAFNPAAAEASDGLKFKVQAPGTSLSWGHFDRDNKALNSMSEVEFIAVVGHYCHPLDQLRAQVQALRWSSPVETGAVTSPNTELWKLRAYRWADEDGRGLARRCRADCDTEVQATIEHCERAAILQAIGRGRPTLREARRPLKVLVVTSVPLGDCLPVQRLAEIKELLGENTLSIRQAQALAAGRVVRLAQQQGRASQITQRVSATLTMLRQQTPSGQTGNSYLEPGLLALVAGVAVWHLQLLGLDKFIWRAEYKPVLGPELYKYIYKPHRGLKPFVLSPNLTKRGQLSPWRK